MQNHLHLVLRQGRERLDRVMQPLLRRTALLVQRSHGLVGHVFERRYGDHACLDPDYARNAVVYTNLNPLRAGLEGDPGGYAWSSHAFYLGEAVVPETLVPALAVDEGLRLFASRDNSTIGDLRAAYWRFVNWQLARDRHRAAERRGEEVGLLPVRPSVLAGDLCWSRSFAPLFRDASAEGGELARNGGSATVDLEAIARQTLTEHAPNLRLDVVRGNSKRRAIVRLRRLMIPRMNAAGHTGSAIARYLGVTPQCVSNVLRAARDP